MYTDEQREQTILKIRKLLNKDSYFDTDNVATAIAAIMEYCIMHDNCSGCIFDNSTGCCFRPQYINAIPENWF